LCNLPVFVGPLTSEHLTLIGVMPMLQCTYVNTSKCAPCGWPLVLRCVDGSTNGQNVERKQKRDCSVFRPVASLRPHLHPKYWNRPS